MVDFSRFFVLFEYLKELDGLNAYLSSGVVWMAAGGAALLCLLISFFFRRPADPDKLHMGIFLRRVAVVFAVVGLLAALTEAWPAITAFSTGTLGLSVQNLVLLVLGTVLLVLVLIFAPLRRRQQPGLDNTSLLNKKQRYGVVLTVSLLLLGLLLSWRFTPQAFHFIIMVLIFVTEALSVIFWFYDPLIYIFSRLSGRRRGAPPLAPTPGKLNRLAVIACAHNEEAVIGQLIRSVYATAYPRNGYDLFILCDNCDDATADVALKEGAIPMVRNEPDKRGKGFGLEWMFDILATRARGGDVYDAYVVLDADNLVNRQFFDEVNERLNEGYEILQTYLGTKNPGDTWVSKCYALAYCLSDANYQNAHDKMGLSAQMGGTGMVIRPKVLEEVGWRTDSLTEDLVLTTRYVLEKDRPCSWVNNARLYDEKPLKLQTSIRQRTRWMQGHMDAMTAYAGRCFWKGLKNMSFKQIDIGFYLMRPFLNLLMFGAYFARWMAVLFFPNSVFATSFFMNNVTATILIVAYLLIQLYTLWAGKYLRYSLWIPLQWVFTYTWYLPIFRGLMKRSEKYWVSTRHERAIGIEEVQEDKALAEAYQRLEGLDNLHRLPLGQILLKAAVISAPQLDAALRTQREKGGTIGSIILETHALSPETLNTYLALQEHMREKAALAGAEDKTPMLGQILLDAEVITRGQLQEALDYQAAHGGRIGECLVATKCLPPELLDVFLEVQQVLDIHYVSADKAHHLIRGVVATHQPELENVLYAGGIISHQQRKIALEFKAEHGGEMGEVLLELGYVSPQLLETILRVHDLSRRHRVLLARNVAA